MDRFFRIGSMAGLMALFSRHSLIITNFRIFRAESRLIDQLGTGEEQVCGGGQTGPWSACGVLYGPGY